jgi:hypothetical protein
VNAGAPELVVGRVVRGIAPFRGEEEVEEVLPHLEPHVQVGVGFEPDDVSQIQVHFGSPFGLGR